MNTDIVTIVTSLLVGFLVYLRRKDYQKFLDKADTTGESQKHVIDYIFKLELKIIIMWVFILLNIRFILV